MSQRFAFIVALVLSSFTAPIAREARAQATPTTVTILRRTPVKANASHASSTIGFINPSTIEVTQVKEEDGFVRLLLRQIDRRWPATGYGYILAADVAVDSATTAPVRAQADSAARARTATAAPARPAPVVPARPDSMARARTDTATVARTDPAPNASAAANAVTAAPRIGAPTTAPTSAASTTAPAVNAAPATTVTTNAPAATSATPRPGEIVVRPDAPPPSPNAVDSPDLAFLKQGPLAAIVQRPIAYQIGKTRDSIVVPAGFVTEFTSIPRALWTELSPTGEQQRAAIVHDYLYWFQPCEREEADNLLMIAMRQDGVSDLRRGAVYTGVRMGSADVWNANRVARDRGGLKIVPPQIRPTARESWSDFRTRLGKADIRGTAGRMPRQKYCDYGKSQQVP